MFSKPHLRNIALLFVVSSFFGFASLSWGISHLSPSWIKQCNPVTYTSFHPDEPFVMIGGYIFALHETPTENYFYWGGTGLFTVSGMIARALLCLQPFSTDFLAQYSSIHILTGRLFCLATGVCTVLLLYGIGAKLFNPEAGLFAALLFCVSPFYIEAATQFRPDMPALFGMALSLFSFILHVQSQKKEWLIACGVGLGLAAAFRLPNAAVALSFLPHWLCLKMPWAKKANHFLILMAACAATYTALSPHFLWYPREALSFFKNVSTLSSQPQADTIGRNLLSYYLLHVVPYGLGQWTACGAYAAFFLCLMKHLKTTQLIVVNGVVFWLLAGTLQFISMRYALPLAFFLTLASAFLLFHTGSTRPILRRAAAMALLLHTSLLGADRLLLRIHEDTRFQVQAWMGKHFSGPEKLGLLNFSNPQNTPWPDLERFPNTRLYYCGYRAAFSIPSLEDADVDYWLLNQFDWRQGERLGKNDPLLEEGRFIQRVREGVSRNGIRWKKIAAFPSKHVIPWIFPSREWEPEDLLRVSPGYEIYQKVKA